MERLRNRKYFYIILALGIVMILSGFTYALFYYSRSSNVNVFTSGDIRMDFTKNTTFPASSYMKMDADTARSIDNNFVELTVTGSNTTNNYVRYSINLIEGLGIPEGYVQKFRAEDLRFDVYDLDTLAILIGELKINSFDEPLYIGYIPPKTDNFVRRFRIRLWVDNEIPIDNSEIYPSENLDETAIELKLELNGESVKPSENVFYVDMEQIESNGDGFTYTKLYFNGNNIQSIRYVAHKGGRANPTGPVSDPTERVRDPGGETYYKAIYDRVSRVETGLSEMMTRTADTNAYVCFIATFEDGTETPFSPYNCPILFNETVQSNIVKDLAPPATKTLKTSGTILVDSEYTRLYNSISSSSASGLFILSSTSNDEYPIYFYRGEVQNNHLIFANKCWRIVRTTETGGTKIIYDGEPSSGVCNNNGEATHIKKAVFNYSPDSPAYIGYKYGSVRQRYESLEDLSDYGNIVYGKNVIWDGTKYTLTDTIEKNGANYSTDYKDTSADGIRYHHYTCLNDDLTCPTVNYVYYLDSSTMYYMTLTGGKTHTQLLNEMLNNDGTVKSNAYKELAYFYTKNLYTYSEYIEDTVFCNDKSIADYGGWDINNENTSYLSFGAYGRLITNKNPSLVCPNNNDKYTVSESNGNGELEYPIGLLTADEYAFAGARYNSANKSFYLYNGLTQWSLSPSRFTAYSANEFDLSTTGALSYGSVNALIGLRPVVSLNRNVQITGGDGSDINPYTVTLN